MPDINWGIFFSLFFLLFATLTLVVFIRVTVRHLFLLLERRVAYLQGIEITKISAINHLENIFTEILLVILKLMTYPFKYLPQSKGKGNTPIILIHGYLGTKIEWTLFKKYLISEGIGPVYCVNLFPKFNKIEIMAKNFAKFFDKIHKKHPEVILIGHSMGGIVASYYAEFVNPDGIKKIITLGTPFYGTKMAAFSTSNNAHQLITNHPFLLSLNKRISESPIKYYNVASNLDTMIIPPSNALLKENLKDKYIVDTTSHNGLLYSKQIAQKIKKWILE